MKKAELIRRFSVGSRWKTQFLNPLRPENRIAPERTVLRHQSNGCWFSPAPWSPREGFLDWPKATNIQENSDGSITLTFNNGQPYAQYWELK
jgi:hypothetical protein